ncbi:glutamate--tRNA ligase, partial [Candidatus Bathyarchaeota archaeon]|nr:glutamate--tRNA ligase [Candidatus Bathyarchaeota archaeon]
IINVGRLGLEAGILSKSKMRVGIEDGTYTGWDDPRLGSLVALRKRGIQPETIRATMLHVGPKPVNVSISWDNFASTNRKIIEKTSNRYGFIRDPVVLNVRSVKKTIVAKLPVHPDYPDRGTREYPLAPEDGVVSLVIPGADAEKLLDGMLVRLMGIANVKVTDVGDAITAEFHSLDHLIAREEKAPFVNWLPINVGVKAKVVMADASVADGIAEASVEDMKPDDMFQFERFGYCRVDESKPFKAYYAHK